MKKCIRCGELNNDKDRFCHNCGFPLKSRGKNDNIIERFWNANKFTKLISITILIFVVLFIIGVVSDPFLEDSFSEETETNHIVDFNALDMDCDGALTFDEAAAYAPEVNTDELSKIFDKSDKNQNSVLKGGEFDRYIYKIKEYNKELEKQENTDEQTETDDSSSNMIPIDNGHGKCPSCGNEIKYVYKYYEESGRPFYHCTECMYWSYDESEFYDK